MCYNNRAYLFLYIMKQKGFEFETFLTIRYDNHGQAIHIHEPNQKKREKGGWTTQFVKIKSKKKV